jgi:hypothetical protein
MILPPRRIYSVIGIVTVTAGQFAGELVPLFESVTVTLSFTVPAEVGVIVRIDDAPLWEVAPEKE